MLENLRSKGYYKFLGVLSWIVAPYDVYMYIYAFSPNDLGSLIVGFGAIGLGVVLLAIYCLLSIIAICDYKRIVNKNTNIFIDIGYILGVVAVICTLIVLPSIYLRVLYMA